MASSARSSGVGWLGGYQVGGFHRRSSFGCWCLPPTRRDSVGRLKSEGGTKKKSFTDSFSPIISGWSSTARRAGLLLSASPPQQPTSRPRLQWRWHQGLWRLELQHFPQVWRHAYGPQLPLHAIVLHLVPSHWNQSEPPGCPCRFQGNSGSCNGGRRQDL